MEPRLDLSFRHLVYTIDSGDALSYVLAANVRPAVPFRRMSCLPARFVHCQVIVGEIKKQARYSNRNGACSVYPTCSFVQICAVLPPEDKCEAARNAPLFHSSEVVLYARARIKRECSQHGTQRTACPRPGRQECAFQHSRRRVHDPESMVNSTWSMKVDDDKTLNGNETNENL